MKRKIFALLLCFVLVMAMPITAHADMGPKPSVRIEFTGIEGETYYGTFCLRVNPLVLHLPGMETLSMPIASRKMPTMISG